MICISINTYSQGNLNITLLPKTYVGNYNLSCNGGNNGEIDVLITGGTSPYTLVWNNNSTANPLLNLTAGTYTVTVTDAANATAQASATLIEPPALGYNLEVSQFGEYNLQYFGSTLGTIKINSSGGTPSYLVIWNDNNTELIRDSLASGTYSFVLTDANGCTLSGNKTLTQPAVLSGTATQLQAVSCFEGEDGKAQITASGGIAPYHYLWDNGSFSATPEDLRAGVHEVHITDDADNTLTLQVTITEPTAIDVQISKSNYPNNFNVSCYNCFNGTIDAVASGGTAPYTFEWIWQENSIGTTANLSNLGGGDYNLIISDQNNCRYRGEVNLKEPERQDWGMSGNAGTDPATQFIGTTDSVDVVLKSNNIEQLRLSNNYAKISSGNLLIGDSLGVFSRTDTSGNKILRFGLERDEVTGNHFICGQNYLPPGTTQNIFGGFIYAVAQANQPQLAMGADGSNGIIETSAAVPENSSVQSESRLLLNYYCGRDVLVGNSQAGNLIANNRLGVGVTDFDTDPLTVFQSNGNSWLNGNVRIGNQDNPQTYKLAVHGIVFAREVKVTQSTSIWPDYVFDENYELTSLENLSTYLKENKHLPKIPSAADVKENGFSMGEMTPLLLLKIEELTLYLLQQQKEIASLQEEIKQLKGK
jgi:hypothetical protein